MGAPCSVEDGHALAPNYSSHFTGQRSRACCVSVSRGQGSRDWVLGTEDKITPVPTPTLVGLFVPSPCPRLFANSVQRFEVVS